MRAACLFRCFDTRNPDFLLRMFKAYVQPILEYASPVWRPYLLKDIDLIESVQRTFTRRLSLPHRPLGYSERLAYLQLDSVELRHVKIDLMTIFKVIYGHIDVDFGQFYAFAPRTDGTQTRSSASLKLALPEIHRGLALYRNSFACRSVRLWNSLPPAAQFSPSIACFNSQINQIDLSAHLKGRSLQG